MDDNNEFDEDIDVEALTDLCKAREVTAIEQSPSDLRHETVASTSDRKDLIIPNPECYTEPSENPSSVNRHEGQLTRTIKHGQSEVHDLVCPYYCRH